MGAASSLANAAVELSGEELVAARAQVQDHVGRLEADNAALKARVALLEGDAAAARARQACAATDAAPRAVTPEDREQLPPGLEGLAPWSAAARALAAARAVTGEFERRAAADGVVARCAAVESGDGDFRDVYGVMWDRVARRSDDLAAYVAAAAPCAALDARRGPARGGRRGARERRRADEAALDAHFRALGDVAGVACDPPAALKKVARIVEKVVALGSRASSTCSAVPKSTTV
ncbi:hypothetical protein JL722_12060 [Aureococcus anophagefferens]|nr:hypothetical protein JL722_12060 [Aureococcus anophagefferens]